MRNDNPDETDGAADGYRGAGGERGADEGSPLRTGDIQAAGLCALVAKAQQVQRPREPGKRRERDHNEWRRRDNWLVTADIEIPHQPSENPIGLREISEVLNQENEGREERV